MLSIGLTGEMDAGPDRKTMGPGLRRGLTKVWIAFATALALSWLVLLPYPVAADAEPSAVKQMQVSVWPEFDEPRVLVIYQGELADTGEFPRRVAFRLPKGAEANQVCALRVPGEHLCQEFEMNEDEAGILLSYDLPVPAFFLEFYYHPIDGEGARDIAFEFMPVSTVDSLTLEIQQPSRASGFSLIPPAATTQSDAVGMTYYLYSLANVGPGEAVKVNISYNKTDAIPSTEKRQVIQANAGSGNRAGDFGTSWLVVGFGSVTVASLVGYSAYRRRHDSHLGEEKPCSGCGGWVGRYNQSCPVCGERVTR